jgi:ribose transport system permease protein
MMTARLGNGVPTGGMGYETDAIASAVIGGASLSGAEGTIIGTVLGSIIMQTLRNGGNLLGINPFIMEIVIGLLIIGAVMLDKRRAK